MSEEDRQIETILQGGKKQEAASWLNESTETSFRSIGEMEPAASQSTVKQLYDCGAQEVIAAEINAFEGLETTNILIVVLPEAATVREKLFRYEATRAEEMGYAPVQDNGQRYMLLHWD